MKGVKNVYPDEQQKIDDRFQTEMELSMKILDLLDQYGYDLEAKLVDGMPEIQLIKRS